MECYGKAQCAFQQSEERHRLRSVLYLDPFGWLISDTSERLESRCLPGGGGFSLSGFAEDPSQKPPCPTRSSAVFCQITHGILPYNTLAEITAPVRSTYPEHGAGSCLLHAKF